MPAKKPIWSYSHPRSQPRLIEESIVPAAPAECIQLSMKETWKDGKGTSLAEVEGTVMSSEAGEKAELTIRPRWALSLYLRKTKINMSEMIESDP